MRGSHRGSRDGVASHVSVGPDGQDVQPGGEDIDTLAEVAIDVERRGTARGRDQPGRVRLGLDAGAYLKYALSSPKVEAPTVMAFLALAGE